MFQSLIGGNNAADTYSYIYENNMYALTFGFATLLAMALGTPAAVGLTRMDFPGKALLTAVLISPMVVPVVIVGVATYLVFALIGPDRQLRRPDHGAPRSVCLRRRRIGDLAGLRLQPCACCHRQPGRRVRYPSSR